MNKYILMLGVAGVSIGSYCAYAGNSATMTVSATITHDVSLSVDHDLNMGTITVNPGADWDLGGQVSFALDGTGMSSISENITAYSGFSIGTFTANVPDSCKVNGMASDISDTGHPCFRAPNQIMLGNAYADEPYVIYDSGNKFKFQYNFIFFGDNTIPQSGSFEDDITIEYIL
ncbi:MAG: hypothetical protein IJ529_03520 [Alphaproteobacteria bacterium]|nr:hypothetical protein [Alphaproteobacteria bacterium]